MKKTALIPCREPGCQHAAFTTPQGESMHYNRVHSRRILVPKQKNAAKNGLIKLSPARSETEPPAEKRPKVTRKYTRRNKHVETHAHVDIMFCPRCLCNLYSVGVGMAMAKANSQVNGCPSCGLDLRVLAVGMAMTKTQKV